MEQQKFWTSMPEGRQKLAEQIGPLIENYYRSKMKKIMCYYNGVKVTRSEYIRLKSIEKAIANYDFLITPLHVGFLYQPAPVLKRIAGKEDFDVIQMEWGFIPESSKWPYIETREQLTKIRKGYVDEKGKFVQYTFLNAVSEELLAKNKIYRDAALNRRCLVLSTGFLRMAPYFSKK